MFRPMLRTANAAAIPRALPTTRAARRFLSTAPPHQRSRSWKSSAARWAVAGGLVCYYNTATAFAEEPAYAQHAPPESSRDTETYPTIEAEVEQRRSKAQTQPQLSPEPSETVAIVPDAEAAIPGSPEGLEEEASQQGAFNEETGEINWECPCLGGMAHGPCGDQFRAAFSCFVFSKDEPKGVDCIEHFKTMQNCFRDHPEIYGSELEDEELEMQAELDGREAPLPASAEPVAASVSAAAPSASTSDLGATHGKKVENGPADSPAVVAGKRERAEEARQQVANDHGVQSETGNLVPKAAHDAT